MEKIEMGNFENLTFRKKFKYVPVPTVLSLGGYGEPFWLHSFYYVHTKD